MATLRMQFNELKVLLSEILNKQKYLCATADAWSTRAQSYLGMTIHYIDRESYQRQSFLLAFRQLHGKQSYDVLANIIYAIFNEFGSILSRTVNIVTDGGSNFGKMFKHYGAQIEEVTVNADAGDEDDENDDNSNRDDFQFENADENLYFMEDINGDIFVNEILHLNGSNIDSIENKDADSDGGFDTYLSEVPIETALPTIAPLPAQKRCESHKLNLLERDFETKFLNTTAQGRLCHAMSKLHTLWVLIRRSSQAKDICKEIIGRCLIAPNDTRWNSKPDAVKLVMKSDIQKNVNKLIAELKSKLKSQSAKNLQMLTHGDFVVLSVYVMVMDPVAQSLDVMQREFNGSQGYILPVLNSMKHRIERIEETSPIVRDFKSAMIQAIDSRFRGYFSFDASNKELLLASITEPKIKTNFIENDDDLLYTKNLLMTECKKIKIEELAIIDQNQDVENVPNVDDGNSFLISFAKNRNFRRDSLDVQIESEVARFLADDRTEISILNEFPNVREVYFKYNTTMSSSAPVERVFSQSKIISTDRRNRLSSEHFEQAMMLKLNKSLLKKIIV